MAELYRPFKQESFFSMKLVLATDGDPERTTEAVRREVRAVDPNQPIYNVRTMSEIYSGPAGPAGHAHRSPGRAALRIGKGDMLG